MLGKTQAKQYVDKQVWCVPNTVEGSGEVVTPGLHQDKFVFFPSFKLEKTILII